MADIIREAEQDMARLELEQEEHEKFLGSISNLSQQPDSARSKTNADEYVSNSQLADQLAHLRKRTANSHKAVELVQGPGMLHGQVQSARNLSVARGTCDPFVKVSYVPPSEEDGTPSLMLRAKQKVHTTETMPNTMYPTWSQSTFNLEVEEPDTFGACCDWDQLRGDLLFAVYDNNDGARNEFIGQVIFPLRSLVDGLTSSDVRGGSQHLHDVWCPLVGRRSSSSTVGEQPEPDEPALKLVMQLILPSSTHELSPRENTRSHRVESKANTPSGKLLPSNIQEAVALGIDDDLEMNELEESATATQDTKVTQKASNKERKALRRRLKGSKKKGGTGSGRPKKFRSKFETAHRIEQEKIARDNLIIQKNLQKTRNGAGAGYGKIVRKTKAQQFMEDSGKQARARLKKRLEKDNEFVYARINKMRGEIQPKPPSKEAWELDHEDRQERQDQILRDQKVAQERYRIASDLTHELEQLRSEASTLKNDISTLQTKAQRYETTTRRNRKAIEDANKSSMNRDAAMSKGPSKKRESSLPKGAKSMASLVPGCRESEFTKRFGRSGGSGGSSGHSGHSGSRQSKSRRAEEEEEEEIDDDRLNELRGELAEHLQTYEMAERQRKKYIQQARIDRGSALQLENQIEMMETETNKVEERREWRAKYAMDNNNTLGGIDREHEQLLMAKNKLTAVQIDVSALEFEANDLKREHLYEMEHLTAHHKNMEEKISRKSNNLKNILEEQQNIQEQLSSSLKSGKTERLQVQIRNMRNAELLCRHAAEHRDTFDAEAKMKVNRAQKNFHKKLKTRDAVDKSSGYI